MFWIGLLMGLTIGAGVGGLIVFALWVKSDGDMFGDLFM